MGKMFSWLGGGQKEKKVAPVTEASGAQKQSDLNRNRQGRALASTNLSGLRGMVDTYNTGKQTLGG